MGSDDLFHKRKGKTAGQLKRRVKSKARRKRVLIVCEGSKTEPFYLAEAVKHFNLKSVEVVFTRPNATDPASIWKHAKEKSEEQDLKGNEYNLVFCVFDRDTHKSFDRTVQSIESAGDKFQAITSNPCFEYWLLLHFTYTRKPFSGTGKKSSADWLLKELKKYLPGYEKGSKGVFNNLLSQVDFARDNAVRALKDVGCNGNPNPSTNIHSLLDMLHSLNEE